MVGELGHSLRDSQIARDMPASGGRVFTWKSFAFFILVVVKNGREVKGFTLTDVGKPRPRPFDGTVKVGINEPDRRRVSSRLTGGSFFHQ